MIMHDYQVSLQLEAQAILVRIEGMKASNTIALLNNLTPPYDQDDFDTYADEINIIAMEIGHG